MLLVKMIFRDLFKDKRRTIMALLAIFIGTLSFAVFTFSNEIIVREIKSVYYKTNPSSAVIMVNNIDDKFIELSEDFTSISEFELKAIYNAKGFTSDNEVKHLELVSINDYENTKINKYSYVEGKKVLKDGEALIDRSALKVAQKEIGDTIEVVLPNEEVFEFKIVGVIEESYLHPALIHDSIYIYITKDSLSEMGLGFNRVDYQITGDKYSKNDIINVNTAYVKMLEENGYKVSSVDISPTPGVSMHYSEYKSGIFLMNLFSFVSFIFGCLIITSLLSSILVSEVKQIGILKAIGISTKKIFWGYITVFGTLIFTFVGFSFICAKYIKNILTSFLLNIANLHADDYSITIPTYTIFFMLSLVVPLLIIVLNVRKGLAISVKDAIYSYSVSGNNKVKEHFMFKSLPRPILLSIRNAYRKKRRFILNVMTLSLSGSMFIAIFTTMITLNNDLNDNIDKMKFDYQIYTDAIDVNKLGIEKLDNVENYEIFQNANARLIYSNGDLGNTYNLSSIPSQSKMFESDVIDGRWFDESKNNEVVIGHKVLKDEFNYNVGDIITLEVDETIMSFNIVGITKNIAENAIYMSEETFKQFISNDNAIYNIRMNIGLTNTRSDRKKLETFVNQIDELNSSIYYSQSKNDFSKMAIGHFSITIWTFLLVILTLIIISSFGLTATTLLQTSERKKELGVIKAIGASKKQVKRIIKAESMFVAFVAYILSIVISIPLCFLSIWVFENNLIKMPLDIEFTYAIIAYIIWFLIVIIIAHSSCMSAIRRTLKLSVKDVLAQN